MFTGIGFVSAGLNHSEFLGPLRELLYVENVNIKKFNRECSGEMKC